jgi:atypical dual specificity phosphatase
MLKVDWIEKGILAASGIPVGRDNCEALCKQGIRAIVTLTEHPLTVFKETPPDVLEALGLECLHVPVNDQYPPSEAQINEVMQFIEQMKAESKPVLVHCFAGVGRTGTMLHAYYLMQGDSLEEAKSKVRLARPTSQWLMLSEAQKTFLSRFAAELDVKEGSKDGCSE